MPKMFKPNFKFRTWTVLLPFSWFFFSNMLAIFLDKYFNDGRPEFIFLRENLYLFNIFYETFSDLEYTQISLLILVAKERSLKISKDDCLKNFNKFNCISQSILVTQFTSKLLSYANINDKLVVEFSNFIIDENNIWIIHNVICLKLCITP